MYLSVTVSVCVAVCEMSVWDVCVCVCVETHFGEIDPIELRVHEHINKVFNMTSEAPRCFSALPQNCL